jgi:hypothetical protein
MFTETQLLQDEYMDTGKEAFKVPPDCLIHPPGAETSYPTHKAK